MAPSERRKRALHNAQGLPPSVGGLQGPRSHRGRWLLMDVSLGLSACICALYFVYGMVLVNSEFYIEGCFLADGKRSKWLVGCVGA